MPLLVRTPSPYSRESLFGFVLRVAEANGYETPRHIWALAEIPRGLEQAPGFPVERLAAVLGQGTQSLRSIAYRKSSDKRRSFKILDQPLGDDLRDAPLRLTRSTFCPRCASDEGYIDTFWDLTVAVACPTHKCWGLAACPGCSKPLSWIRRGLLKCTCGASLADADLAPADPALAELMTVIHARLHGDSAGRVKTFTGLPVPQLMSMPLSSLVRMISALGSHALSNDQKSRPNPSFAPGRAATILSDWPNNYRCFLSELGGASMQRHPDAIGLRRQFNRFYSSMFKNRVFSASATFLRDEFIRFGQQHWGRAYVDQKLLGGDKVSDASRFRTMTQVARRFRISKPVMQRMISDGTLVTRRIGTGGTARMLIDVAKSTLPKQSAGLLSARKAAAALEVPVSVLHALRNRGVFTSAPHCGRIESFYAEDVEAFRVQVTALPIDTERGEGMPISKLMRLKLKSATGKAKIVAAALAGEITIVGRERDTVGGLVLDATELKQMILDQLRESQAPLYTLTRTAKMTGLDPSTIKNAIDARLFKSRTVDGVIHVTHESVNAFNATYVVISKLADELHTSSACLSRICRANGIPTKEVRRTNREISQKVIRRTEESALTALWKKSPSGRRQRSRPTCVERVREYLHRLESSGERLPRRAGRPHKIKIAMACSMSRERIYDNPVIAQMIAEFDKQEQLAGAAARPIEALKQYLDGLKRSGQPLPLWGAHPNMKLIAKTCRFSRKEFNRDPALLAELSRYEKLNRAAASQRS